MLAFAPILGACVSYRAQPLHPEQELESLRRPIDLADVRIERTTVGDGASPVELRFDPSDGLDEAELVSVALTLNPSLRAKRLEIGAAQALLVSAGLWPNPELDAFVRPGIGGIEHTTFGLDLLVSLLRPGERPARRALGEARVEEVHAEIALAELRLAADVRRARVRSLAAQRRVGLLEQESSLRGDAVRLVGRQRELGETTDIAVALVELDAVAIERALRDGRAAAARATRELNELAGLPPDYALLLGGTSDAFALRIVEDIGDDELDRRLLAGRFDLRASAASYRVREAELALAIARQYPLLRIGPSFEKDIGGSESLGLAGALELPLFDRNQGEIAARLAARDRAHAEYVALLHALRARAFESRASLRRATEEALLQERETVPLIERVESLFEGALRARELSVFEWISARTKAVQARIDLLDALVAYATAVVEFETSTGGPRVARIDGEGADDERKR